MTVKVGFNVDNAATKEQKGKGGSAVEQADEKNREKRPAQGIEPGTIFEDLPDEWTCSECGMGKNKFEKI